MKIYLSLALLISSFITFAQGQPWSYIIKLKDKTSSDYSLSRPEQFLSARAIERRQKHGIAITASDIPVVASYLEEIKSKGGNVVYNSKWLNTIIVTTTDTGFLNRVSLLPYVQKIQLFNDVKSASVEKEKPVKLFFQNESVGTSPKSTRNKSGANIAADNYGAAFNQINILNGIQLHALGFRGQGMVIAVIDAGFNSVNVLHAFDSLWVNHQILGTRDFVQPNNDLFSKGISFHGMMVLSTMGANVPGQIIGTAPKASYWLLRSEDANAEYVMEEYFWANAAEYADSVGADIINSSLGYSVFDNPLQNLTYADMNGKTAVITIAADIAAQKGILVVNSAGNSGAVTDAWKYITAPADGDSVFAIGAVDSQGRRAAFSSRGPTSDGRIKPNIAALGEGTAVADLSGGVSFGNGTSFSSPIIAGMTACLWQANKFMSNMDLIDALQRSGSQAANPDTLLGYGIPDYMKANGFLVTNGHPVPTDNNEVNLFPNPFRNGFVIDFSVHPPKETFLVSLKTISGYSLFVGHFSLKSGSKLVMDNLTNLVPGMYILHIQSEKMDYVQKVIKY